MRIPFRASLGPALLLLAGNGCAGVDPGDQTVEPEGEDVAAARSSLDITVFSLPPAGLPERAAIVAKYPALDPTGIVPRGLLEDAIAFFDINKPHIPKQAYFVVVDFAPYSGEDRFFLVDVGTGVVEPHKVAHGDGTDPDNDGYADYFGNESGSHMSSLGFYLTGEIYDGTHPHSMRIDGLSPDGSPNDMANTNVRDRLIVVHEASYVDDSNTSQQGRSNGCFALDPSIEVGVVDRIHDGTMMYAATSPLNDPVGSSGGTGAGGTGGSAGVAGSSAAGGTTPSTCGAPSCNGCASCADQCLCEGNDEATCSQVCASESKPPNSAGSSGSANRASSQSSSCGAASLVGSSPDPRPSGVFLAALALGVCGLRRRRR